MLYSTLRTAEQRISGCTFTTTAEERLALPTIRGDLGISLANLQWIVSAYGLTFAGFLMLSGRASDLYGRKRLFMIGLVVFSLASLAGGLATSEIVLIAARAVQGVGAAL